MTLLLDIDNVLIPWGRRQSLFTDWVRPKVRFLDSYSPAQLELIRSRFNDIRWHTTWIQGDSANAVFAPTTGFGPFPAAISPLNLRLRLPSAAQFTVTPPHYEYYEPGYVAAEDIPEALHNRLQNVGWWKLNAVAALLALGTLPGKVVWVDDELNDVGDSIEVVLDHFGARDRFMLIAPDDHWSETMILRAADWYDSH